MLVAAWCIIEFSLPAEQRALDGGASLAIARRCACWGWGARQKTIILRTIQADFGHTWVIQGQLEHGGHDGGIGKKKYSNLKPSRSPKVRSPLFATSCSGWYSVAPPARRRCRRPTRRARRPSRSRSRSRASRATTTTRASSSLRSEYLPEARRSTTSSCTDGGYIVVVKTPHPYASRRLDRRRSSNPLASTSHAAARWDAPRAP